MANHYHQELVAKKTTLVTCLSYRKLSAVLKIQVSRQATQNTVLVLERSADISYRSDLTLSQMTLRRTPQ